MATENRTPIYPSVTQGSLDRFEATVKREPSIGDLELLSIHPEFGDIQGLQAAFDYMNSKKKYGVGEELYGKFPEFPSLKKKAGGEPSSDGASKSVSNKPEKPSPAAEAKTTGTLLSFADQIKGDKTYQDYLNNQANAPESTGQLPTGNELFKGSGSLEDLNKKPTKPLNPEEVLTGILPSDQRVSPEEVRAKMDAQKILDVVADNVAYTQDVPKLNKVIADKTKRNIENWEAAKVTEEELGKIVNQEAFHDKWAETTGKNVIESAKQQVGPALNEKYKPVIDKIQQDYQNGLLNKPSAEAEMKKISDSYNTELNAAVGQIYEQSYKQDWEKEYNNNRTTYEEQAAKLQGEKFLQANRKSNAVSQRTILTLQKIADSDQFKEMNFLDKKRVIAATWDATRLALEKKGYKRDYIERYKDQFMSEFVYAASQKKGQITSYGIREMAPIIQKELDEQKEMLGELMASGINQPTEQVGISLGGGIPVTGKFYDDKTKEELAILNQAQETLNAVLARPEFNKGTFAEGLAYGFTYGHNIPVPYVKSAIELGNNLNIYKVSKKAQEGKELNDGEKLLLHTLGMQDAYQSSAKASFAFNAGESTTVSLPYMADMIAGNWVAAPTRAAVKEGLLKLAGKSGETFAYKNLVAQPISVLVGEMARTAADPVRWASSYVDHMNPAIRYAMGEEPSKLEDQAGNKLIPMDQMIAVLDKATTDLTGAKTGKGMDPIEAFAYGFLDNFKENVSEQIGGALSGEIGGKIIKSLAKNNQWAKRLIIGNMLRANGGLTPTAFTRTLNDLKDAAHFNGFIGENIEEYAAQLAEEFMYNRPLGSTIDEEFVKQTAAVTGALQIPMQFIGLGAKYIAPKAQTFQLSYQDENGIRVPVDVPLALAQKALAKGMGPVAQAEFLLKELGKTPISPEQKTALSQAVQSKMYWDALERTSQDFFGMSFDALDKGGRHNSAAEQEAQRENLKQFALEQGLSIDFLEDARKGRQAIVKQAAWNSIKKYLLTKDQQLLEKIARENRKAEQAVPLSQDAYTTEPFNPAKAPKVPEPTPLALGLPAATGGKGTEEVPIPEGPGVEEVPLSTEENPHLTTDDDVETGFNEDKLNEIGGFIMAGLPLNAEDRKIYDENLDWFEQNLEPEMLLPKIEPEGLSQGIEGMKEFQDEFLKDQGISIEDYNAMDEEGKKALDNEYKDFLAAKADIEFEKETPEAKAKVKAKLSQIPEDNRTENDYLAYELWGKRFKIDQLEALVGKAHFEQGYKANGKKKSGQTYALNWSTAQANGMTLDQLAKELIDDEQSIFYGKDPQDVVAKIADFVLANPGGARSYINDRIKQISIDAESEEGIDRSQLQTPDLMNAIDDFVDEFTDEEVEEMEAFLADEGNLEAIDAAIDEWLAGDPFSQVGAFINVFSQKYFNQEGTSVKESALAKKLKQLINAKQGKSTQEGAEQEGEGETPPQENGNGESQKEETIKEKLSNIKAALYKANKQLLYDFANDENILPDFNVDDVEPIAFSNEKELTDLLIKINYSNVSDNKEEWYAGIANRYYNTEEPNHKAFVEKVDYFIKYYSAFMQMPKFELAELIYSDFEDKIFDKQFSSTQQQSLDYAEDVLSLKPQNAVNVKKSVKKKVTPNISNIDIDNIDLSGFDVLAEADLFGGNAKGKSDFRKQYETQLAEAKKELKTASDKLEDLKKRAKASNITGEQLEKALKPFVFRYEMALKNLDSVRNLEKNVRNGEESQMALFEGMDVTQFLQKDLTNEQREYGAKLVGQFFSKGIYDFPRIAAVIEAKLGAEKLYSSLPALVKTYLGESASVSDEIADKMNTRVEVRKFVEDFIVNFNTEENEPTDVETGPGTSGTTNQGGEQNGGNEPGGTQPNGGQGGNVGTGSTGRGSGTGSVSTNSGTRGGGTVSGTQSGGKSTTTGNATGRSTSGVNGVSTTSTTNGTSEGPITNPTNEGGNSFVKKQKQQIDAEPIAVKFGDLDNIKATLPIAFESQQEDVQKAEIALIEQQRKAVLFTNGTGTGKTSTALGIVKRIVKEGKSRGEERRVLILTPKQSINEKFVKEGAWFNLPVYNLSDTKDFGDGENVVVTTHANFRDNEAVQNQEWDLIIVDEADQLMQSQSGKVTNAIEALRKAGNHYSVVRKIAEARVGNPELQRINEEISLLKLEQQGSVSLENTQRIDNLIAALVEQRKPIKEQYERDLQDEMNRLEHKTRVVFMSATPFASVPALDYAEGFLFDYPKDANGRRSYDLFMSQNFGWQFNEWGKLKNKGNSAEIDKGYLEREFHEKLKKEGVLFTRKLESSFDYSRHFLLLKDPMGEQGIGRTIDNGISILESDEFKLNRLVDAKFDFLYTMRLLEAYKAKETIPYIQSMLDEGKKVVVFHNYNAGVPSHPFHFSEEELRKAAGNDPKTGTVNQSELQRIRTSLNKFNAEYPQYSNLDMRGLQNPIDTLTEHFGEENVLVFNGNVTTKNRTKTLISFNSDPDKNLLVVQKEAGKAGIDLHDTTGENQRVLINLGLPIMSNDAIQSEGRIYRMGNKSNAVMIYPVIHTNFERFVWSSKSAPRAGTSENFALGNEARGLEQSFKQGYIEADELPEEMGVGGKESDYAMNQMSDYDRARQAYATRQKRTRSSEPLGEDYYPTPEPVGFKMVEWADVRPGDDVLEPSAGSGNISRYFPEYANADIIEPSNDLRSQAALFGHRNTNVFGGRFEELSIGNKYNRIIMNPPFGFAGKTAMEHVAKAFQHLKDGGRLVALVPEGKMNDRLREFLYGENAPEDAVLRAVIKMPVSTFEKAGTKVSTQIIVIDRIKDPAVRERVAALGGTNLDRPNTMLQRSISISELFDEIEDMGIPLTVDIESEKGKANASIKAIVTKNYHAKEKRDNWVVTLDSSVTKEKFAQLLVKARFMKGNYSVYSKEGAIPGFQFKNEDTANAFADWINNGAGKPRMMADAIDVYQGNKPKGILSTAAAEALQREVEASYVEGSGELTQKREDVRMKLYNYENPIAEKNVNGVNVRITQGLTEAGKPTYLLYGDGKIVGKFYSVQDAKNAIGYIEENLVGNSININGEVFTKKEILNLVSSHLSEMGIDDYDASIVDIYLAGSRMRGTNRKKSDFDVVLEFKGNMREDDLFNALNNEPLEINGVTVDINPIKEGKSGTIEDFKKSETKYLEDSFRDNLTQALTDTFTGWVDSVVVAPSQAWNLPTDADVQAEYPIEVQKQIADFQQNVEDKSFSTKLTPKKLRESLEKQYPLLSIGVSQVQAMLKAQIVGIKNPVKFSTATTNEALGAYWNNTVYIDPRVATPQTPIHEFGHAFVDLLKAKRPDLWKRGKELVMNSPYYESVKNSPSYANLTDEDAIAEEALVRAIADKGVQMSSNKEKSSSFKKWWKEFWKAIKDMIGLTDVTPEQLADMNLEEFTQAAVVTMFNKQKMQDLRDAVPADIEDFGVPMANRADAEKHWSDGWEMYTFSEQNEEFLPVTSKEMLDNTPADSLMAYPPSTPEARLEVAIDDLRDAWANDKSIGNMAKVDDAFGLAMNSKFAKVMLYASEAGVKSVSTIAKKVGVGSLPMLEKMAAKIRTWERIKPGSPISTIINKSTTKAFADAVVAAKLMGIANKKELKANIESIYNVTNNKEMKTILSMLSDMVDMDYKSAIQFINETASPSLPATGQVVVNRNGVMQYIYNEKGTDLSQEHFSLSSNIKNLMNEMGVPVRTGRIKKALGYYNTVNKYIKVRSLFEIFTAIHETMHYLDMTNNLSDRIIKDGNMAIMGDLEKIYLRWYANAKETHPTQLKIIEGLAVMMNEYLADPQGVHADYPAAVDAIITPGGIYNFPEINKLMDGMRDIMVAAHSVNPLFRTGLRLADLDEKIKQAENRATHDWFSPLRSDVGWKRYLALQLTDTGAIFKELDKMAGIQDTDKSLDINYYAVMQARGIANAWVTGGKPMAIIQSNGDYEYKDVSVKKIVDALDQVAKNNKWDMEYTREIFNQYLINRRALGDYNRMVDAKNNLDMYVSTLDPDTANWTKAEAKIVKQLNQEYNKWKGIVENDNFDIADVTMHVRAFEKMFAPATAIFDAINVALLDVAKNTGLISAESYREWKNMGDYASFQRYIYDDLTGGSQGSGNAPLSQFKKRKGSADAAFFGSLEAMIMQIPQTLQKAYTNMFWRNYAEFINNYGLRAGIKQKQLNQDFMRVDKTPQIVNGKISFAHLDNNPNLISVYVNGSKQYYQAENYIHALASTFMPERYEGLEKIAIAGAQVFGQLTTSSNPFFALPNLTIDQISTLINTKTKKVVPVGSDLVQLAKAWKDLAQMSGIKLKNVDPGVLARYLALAGDQSTLHASMGKAETLRDLIEKASPKKTVKGYAKGVLDTLALPVNMLEILTRFGEFSRAIEQGDSELVASYKAAHVSGAFYQRPYYFGKSGRILYRSHAYWNAGIQALVGNVRNIKNKPGRYAGVMLFASTIAVMGIAYGFTNGGDDDVAEIMNKTPEEFGRYIFYFDGESWVRVRVPEVVTAITGPMQMYAASALYQDRYNLEHKRDAVDYLVPLREGLPGGIREFVGVGEGIATVDAERLASSSFQLVVPQAYQPAIEAALNKKVYPTLQDIVQGRMAKYEAKYQYNQYTSEVAKFIGQHTDASPEKIDFFLKNQFGSLFKHVLQQTSEKDVPLFQSPYRFSSAKTWSRGDEWQKFNAIAKGVEEHKNSLDPILEERGINTEEVFGDKIVTMGEMFENNAAKLRYLYKIDPEQAKDVIKTNADFKRAQSIKQLSYIVMDHDQSDEIKPETKLKYYQLIYAYNHDQDNKDELMMSVATDLSKIPGTTLNDVKELRKILKMFGKQE